MRWTIHCCLVLGLAGCTRVTQLGGATSADADAPADGQDSADIEADDDTASEGEPDLEEDTATPAPDAPTTCLPGDTTGYRLPNTRWALSVLFASRRLTEPSGNRLQVSPKWLLASAWQTDAFACGGYGYPWADTPTTDEGGCYQLQESTHWTELTRLFPAQFPEAGWSSWLNGDAPERSTLALVHAMYAGHLLLRRVDGADPDILLSDASDPRASTRVAAFFHIEGPWSAAASRALSSCPDNLLDCTDGDLLHHVQGLENKLNALDAAECFDTVITDADLDAFLDGLRDLWPDADWGAIRTRAVAANQRQGFARDGLAVVEAIEDALDTPLSCPEDTLWDHYRYSCF